MDTGETGPFRVDPDRTSAPGPGPRRARFLGHCGRPACFSGRKPEPCNGSAELCDRPFSEVTLPGSHNSMSAEELGWLAPNQTYSIPNQLRRGARTMLIDTYYAKQGGSGGLVNVEPADRNQPGVDMYLCHVACGWGATSLVEELGRIRNFLAANPREVMVFLNEPYITPEDFAQAVTESGLIDFVYTGPTDSWPTLGEMVASGERVVMLSEKDTASVAWYHNAYDGTLQETPYDWPADGTPNGVEMLTEPDLLDDSCRPNRGGSTGSLFLMNHWVSGTSLGEITPDPDAAAVVNRKGALVNRARACEQRRGIKPTILAVDFFGTGDVVGAARALNGVVTRPFLLYRRSKRAVARAGGRAVFRVRIRNIGDADANRVKLCARVPKRLARNPRCANVRVRAGTTVTGRLGIRTRNRARGRGNVRLIVRSSTGKRSARSILRVKPARRR